MNALDGITVQTWAAMTPAQRESARDNSGLSQQLIGFEGCRVEVLDMHDNVRRFQVGKSTGWKPCHLELYNVRAMGGDPADKEYKSVRFISTPCGKLDRR